MKPLILLTILVTAAAGSSEASGINQGEAVKAILGEAENQGYKGMLAVAVGIRNRGTLRGVYGLKAKRPNTPGLIPAEYWKLALKAWKESAVKKLHNADHWENVKAFGTPDWAPSMKEVYRVGDHVFYRATLKRRNQKGAVK